MCTDFELSWVGFPADPAKKFESQHIARYEKEHGVLPPGPDGDDTKARYPALDPSQQMFGWFTVLPPARSARDSIFMTVTRLRFMDRENDSPSCSALHDGESFSRLGYSPAIGQLDRASLG